MIEFEMKVPADHASVRPHLDTWTRRDAEPIEQIDTYYAVPMRDFAETDEALRLRRISGDEGRVELTYKGPKIDPGSKARIEYQTDIGDADAIDAIFDALSFQQAATVEKHRERFDRDGFTVTLDNVHGLGEFVEVEAVIDDDSSIEVTREATHEILRSLGLDPADSIRTSYLELLLD